MAVTAARGRRSAAATTGRCSIGRRCGEGGGQIRVGLERLFGLALGLASLGRFGGVAVLGFLCGTGILGVGRCVVLGAVLSAVLSILGVVAAGCGLAVVCNSSRPAGRFRRSVRSARSGRDGRGAGVAGERRCRADRRTAWPAPARPAPDGCGGSANGRGRAGSGGGRTRRWTRRDLTLQDRHFLFAIDGPAACSKITDTIQWLVRNGWKPGLLAARQELPPVEPSWSRAPAGALHCAATVHPYSNGRSLDHRT